MEVAEEERRPDLVPTTPGKVMTRMRTVYPRVGSNVSFHKEIGYNTIYNCVGLVLASKNSL
jgi:hypothetical protein